MTMSTPDLDPGAGARRLHREPDQLVLQQDEISDCGWVTADSVPLPIRTRLLELGLN